MKTPFKKPIALLLAILAIFGVLFLAPGPAYAEEDDLAYGEDHASLLQEGYVPDNLVIARPRLRLGGSSSADLAGLEEFLITSVDNVERELDVRSYGATVEQFRTVYEKVVNLHPDLFFANGGYSYSWSKSTGVIVRVNLHYTSSSDEEIAQQRTAYAKAKAEVLSLVPSGIPDLEKVKIVHDWLARNLRYGTGTDGLSGYNVYGALVNHVAVCQGYSMAMRSLLDALGIQSVYAVQEITGNLGHMWNLVQVDGLWYHVDATWDDPVTGGAGEDGSYPDRGYYATPSTLYFMKSGAWMRANPSPEGYHETWGVLAGDTVPDTEGNTLYDEWEHWPSWPGPETRGLPLSDFQLSQELVEAEVGSTQTMELWVEECDPNDTRPLHATWASDNPEVASFAWPGYVTYGTKVGKATITCTLEGQKRTCVFWVRGALADAEVSPVPDQTYTGSAIKPKPTVTYGGKTLKEGTDYTLSYKNNVKVGTATITITGKNAYTGTATVTFKIVEKPKPVEPAVPVYRLYNRKTSEHLYTLNKGEYDQLPKITKGDWVQEGIAWYAPKTSKTPVYRLYNKKSGDHHYTTSKGERDALVAKHGWTSEGIAFYSDDQQRLPLYRLYNGRLKRGQHHYTASVQERDALTSRHGWKGEGIGFYGVRAK